MSEREKDIKKLSNNQTLPQGWREVGVMESVLEVLYHGDAFITCVRRTNSNGVNK